MCGPNYYVFQYAALVKIATHFLLSKPSGLDIAGLKLVCIIVRIHILGYVKTSR